MAPKSKKPSFFTKAKSYKTWFQTMGLYVMLGKWLPKQGLKKHDLAGKNAIVTGSNTGLGKGMAFHLASMNANVFLVCRNLKKAETAKEDILKEYPDANITLIELDTSSLEGVKKFASDWAAEGKTIDILIHNAGAGSPPSEDKAYSTEGFEYLYITNFLSNFVMTFLLEKYLAPEARIIFVTSPGVFLSGFSEDFSEDQVKNTMERGFHYPVKGGPYNALLYSHTKLMQLCFARALNWKYRAEGKNGIVANAFCPGYAASDFFVRDGVHGANRKTDPAWYFLRRTVSHAIPSIEACKTGVWLATDKSEYVTVKKAGWFWERMKARTSIVDLLSDEIIARMWRRWCADGEVQWDYLPKEQ